MTAARIIEIKSGEAFEVGDATVTLLQKSGRTARICVQAPAHITITHPLKPAAHEARVTHGGSQSWQTFFSMTRARRS